MLPAEPWEKPETRESRGDVRLFRLGEVLSMEQAPRSEKEETQLEPKPEAPEREFTCDN